MDDASRDKNILVCGLNKLGQLCISNEVHAGGDGFVEQLKGIQTPSIEQFCDIQCGTNYTAVLQKDGKVSPTHLIFAFADFVIHLWSFYIVDHFMVTPHGALGM